MAGMFRNFGLEDFTDDDTLHGLVAYAAQNGKEIFGYGNNPYIYMSLGDAELFLSAEETDDNNFEIKSINTHCGNQCVWNVVNTGIDLTPKDSPKSEKTLLVENESEPKSIVPVNLITADVLPSFSEADKYELQVTALPYTIEYFKDHDEYEQAQPEAKDGHKWLLENGSLIPLSFLHNHMTEVYERGREYEDDDEVVFTATVQKVLSGELEIAGEKCITFIRCFADTIFGRLEFDHTIDQVPEELRKNIKEGAIICGTCIISADAAINKYENGIVKDPEHNIRLLRYSLEKGDINRLASVLTERTELKDHINSEKARGTTDIIKKLTDLKAFVKSKTETYTTLFATAERKECSESDITEKCIVFSDKNEKILDYAVFATTNENGDISQISIENAAKVLIKIDG